jgi:hypothetical protein
MQIALVATVLLAGMWFTVLKPKPSTSSSAPAPVAATTTPAKVLPGVKGLTNAVDKAKGASAASDATNAKIQAASGGTPATAAKKAASTATATAAKPAKRAAVTAAAKVTAIPAKAKAATPAKTKAATPAKTPDTIVDPSDRLLAFLAKGKTLVILFHGDGVDDRAARKAVHRTALADPKHVVSAYVPIAQVGKYEAITSDVNILAAPTILVIGTDGKATVLTGYVDTAVVRQAVGDARRNAKAAAAKKK